LSADAFKRLALLSASTLYALGLVVLWRYFVGLGGAFAIFLFGLAITVLVTLEIAPEKQPAETMIEREGMSRLEIARRHPRDDAFVE
jgi:hypothetical protein